MKQKIQRLLHLSGIVLGVVAIVALLGFAARNTNTTPVKELAVTVVAPEGVHFIDENAVRQQVLAAADAVIGSPIGAVDMVAIEEGLRNIGCVANANVYHTMDGTLHIIVKQREPIVRVINFDGSSFYIDREGWTMPLSANYTARVAVVTGMLFEPFAHGAPVDLSQATDSSRKAIHSDEIYALAKTISMDAGWNALFDQAVIDANSEFELIPRIGGNRVKVGRLDGVDAAARLSARLEKLRTFYQQGIPQSDWRMYSTIDTRFADQVVCTKRSDYRPAPLPKKIVGSAMTAQVTTPNTTRR